MVAGSSGVLAELAGFRLPIESVALQALVSEPIKPLLDCVVMANTVHGYIRQSDKGEMVIGGGADGFNNYTQRGSFHHIEETVRALIETFPVLSRLKMLRQWGGIVDMTGDRSPIIGPSPVPGIFLNCGWGTGGFKAIPGSGWATAEMLARGAPGDLAAPVRPRPLRGGPDDRRERRRGGGALMAGLAAMRPIEPVDPELFELALMTRGLEPRLAGAQGRSAGASRCRGLRRMGRASTPSPAWMRFRTRTILTIVAADAAHSSRSARSEPPGSWTST